MNLRVPIALIPVVLVLACQEPPHKPAELHKIVIDSLYTVSLPDNLKPGYDMHDYAALQYYDVKSDFYVMGMEDYKENFGAIKRRRLKLRAYYRFVEKTAFENVDSLLLVSSESYERSNGLKVQVGDYFARTNYFDSVYDLFYRIAVFESDTYFFQLLIWMPYDDHCDRIHWIDAITNSFEVIGPPEGNIVHSSE